MSDANARARFFAARAAIARREGASAAGFRIVPPAGRFAVSIVMVPRETHCRQRDDGSISIHDAQLMFEGREIDGATVVVDREIADAVEADLRFSCMPVEGDLVLTDDGYRMVAHREPVMAALPLAA